MLITKGGLICAVSTVVVLVIRVVIFFATQTCCFESFNAAVHIMKIIQYLILGTCCSSCPVGALAKPPLACTRSALLLGAPGAELCGQLTCCNH